MGSRGNVFKDLAHVWVGVTMGWTIAGWVLHFELEDRLFWSVQFTALSAVELLCAFVIYPIVKSDFEIARRKASSNPYYDSRRGGT